MRETRSCEKRAAPVERCRRKKSSACGEMQEKKEQRLWRDAGEKRAAPVERCRRKKSSACGEMQEKKEQRLW